VTTWSLERDQVIQVRRVCGIEKFESEREIILHLIGYVHLF